MHDNKESRPRTAISIQERMAVLDNRMQKYNIFIIHALLSTKFFIFSCGFAHAWPMVAFLRYYKHYKTIRFLFLKALTLF